MTKGSGKSLDLGKLRGDERSPLDVLKSCALEGGRPPPQLYIAGEVMLKTLLRIPHDRVMLRSSPIAQPERYTTRSIWFSSLANFSGSQVLRGIMVWESSSSQLWLRNKVDRRSMG